jgi:ubiquinone/menaquinone biosynthesis C-methylase UbiE
MAEDTGAVRDATLIGVMLPVVPGLVGRLEHGIDVADVGCGSGHAVNLIAEAFPRSRFAGFDFITTFDAVHDQARPDLVLAGIARALRPGGGYLCVDIAASSKLSENMDHPLGPLT